MKKVFLGGAAAAALLVGGCAGVPKLNLRSIPVIEGDPSKDDAPPSPPSKVTEIVDHVICELRKAANEPGNRDLKENNYAISVLLTLRVDDSVGLTPSLTLKNPINESPYSFSGSISAGLSGDRGRTFTTKFTIEASQLDKAKELCLERITSIKYNEGVPDEVKKDQEAKLKKELDKDGLYQLDGDLGISEIVREGLKSIGKPRDHMRSKYFDASAAPGFGSFIEFVVTRSLGGLGPLWTVRRLTGPSGSSGLVNGKRKSTDSITLAFAPAPVTELVAKEPNPEIIALIKLIEELIEVQKKEFSQEDSRKPWLSYSKAEKGEAAEALRSLSAQLDKIRSDLDKPTLPAPQAGQSSAAAGAQNLLTNILIQNIATSGRIQ